MLSNRYLLTRIEFNSIEERYDKPFVHSEEKSDSKAQDQCSYADASLQNRNISAFEVELRTGRSIAWCYEQERKGNFPRR